MGVKIDSVSISPETQPIPAGWCAPYIASFLACKVGNLRLTVRRTIPGCLGLVRFQSRTPYRVSRGCSLSVSSEHKNMHMCAVNLFYSYTNAAHSAHAPVQSLFGAVQQTQRRSVCSSAHEMALSVRTKNTQTHSEVAKCVFDAKITYVSVLCTWYGGFHHRAWRCYSCNIRKQYGCPLWMGSQ